MSDDTSVPRGRTCYISASADSDLKAVRSALTSRGIQVTVPDSAYSASRNVESFNLFLDRVDLVIGVVSRQRRSDWTLFEIGAAWARGRKVLLVVPPGASLDPSVVTRGLLVVRASPKNEQAVGFGLDQLLSAPFSAVANDASMDAPRPVSTLVAEEISAAERVIEGADAVVLEQVIGNLLERSGLQGVVRESTTKQGRADFAVWADVFAASVGNPLLVEVKRSLRDPSSLRESASQLSKAVTDSGTRFGLLIYSEGPAKVNVSASLPFNVLAISVRELLGSLRREQFASVVIGLRNQRVHGIDS